MEAVVRGLYGGSAKRRIKTFKGGCMSIGAAIMPFGLIGLQKYIQTRKQEPTQYKKNGKWRRRNTGRRRKPIKLANV